MHTEFQTPGGALTVYPRPRAARRRLLAIGVVLAVALAGGLIGGLSQRRDAAHLIPSGPFSYFPT